MAVRTQYRVRTGRRAIVVTDLAGLRGPGVRHGTLMPIPGSTVIIPDASGLGDVFFNAWSRRNSSLCSILVTVQYT